MDNAGEMEIAVAVTIFFLKLHLVGFDRSFKTIQFLGLKSPVYNCIPFKYYSDI